MGGSSKQVTGYRHFANFLLFIGNPIEKVLGINFDKRGWQTPLIGEQKNPLPVGVVDLPNLYGENEGGVKGLIHAKYGTKTQSPVDFYVDYLAKNDFPPIAYPYQSYLTFKDFYLGNSGYMKEMLLWPKRIHVRNDGRPQWYDEKAEIPEISYISEGKSWSELPVSLSLNCRWGGSSIGGTDVGGTATIGTASFPLFEGETSYQVRFMGAGEIANGDPVGAEPSLYASSIFVHEKGMIPVSEKKGTALPPLRWKTNAMPNFDGYGNGPIVRQFYGDGYFYWGGGEFHYKLATSLNGANVQLLRNNTAVFNFGVNAVSPDWLFTEGYLVLEAGLYEVRYDVGVRYTEYSKVRPLIHFTAKVALSSRIDSGDINPIHKIREIITDDTAMNKPESDVNDINFIKAADRIWDEGLGISWSITEKSCLEAINELCGHIEAGVRVNRQTGLYEMVLFRDDWFEESEIHTLAINKIKSMSLEIANADEAINQLNVSYYNRESIKDSSFSIAENASIRNLNGRVNAEDADFPYFMNQRNAAVVAQWKLKQMSSPVWKGSFTTAEYNARKWNRYDLLKLAWPRKWHGTITVRIMKINLGIGTDVSIDFVEVVPYSSNLSSDIVIDEPIDVAPQPPLACQYEPFEMPYYLAVMALGQRQVDEELSYENNFGLVGVVAEKPQSNSLYAVMMTHSGIEGEEWLRAATINYEPVADLDQIISRTSTSFTVKDSSAIAELPIGTLIKCGSDWIGTPGEWMVFQGVDPYTGVLSVKRGALDSLPQAWGINTKLYFCGNDVAYDSTEYVAGEEVLVSALTTTPSGMLENKGSIAIEMNARAFRPYPPANVKINGLYFPEEVSGNPILTWVNRSRSQQTGGDILGWFDGGVTLESGVTYQLIVIMIDASNVETEFLNVNVGTVNTYTVDLSTTPSSAKQFKIILKSVRDSYESLQRFEHYVVKPLTAPQNLTAIYNQ
ncbi:MAG: hypothetical protein ACN6NV_08420 [Acinetobacter gandensis]|uniref:hypothetical protein n=1 Tax=Acinetobacter gandensis TaxID=1443941 RepID=UPI003CFD6CA4